jgi:hypothetical protein
LPKLHKSEPETAVELKAENENSTKAELIREAGLAKPSSGLSESISEPIKRQFKFKRDQTKLTVKFTCCGKLEILIGGSGGNGGIGAPTGGIRVDSIEVVATEDAVISIEVVTAKDAGGSTKASVTATEFLRSFSMIAVTTMG